MSNSGIYKITNKNNGKIYIGSSKNIKNRWRGHLSDLRRNKHHSPYLQKAFNKHGEDAFVFEILQLSPIEDLIKIEQKYMDDTKCYCPNNGYNYSKTAGLPDSDILKASQTPETKKKQSDASKKMWNNPETRKRISRQISLNTKKQWQNPEIKQKMMSKISSDEHKKTMSSSIKEIWQNEKYRQKRAEGLKKAITQEYKNKLSSIMQERYSDPEYCKKHKESIKGKKKVYCITNNVIYNSISDAAKFVGVSGTKYVKKCIASGKLCRGYLFRYCEVNNEQT